MAPGAILASPSTKTWWRAWTCDWHNALETRIKKHRGSDFNGAEGTQSVQTHKQGLKRGSTNHCCARLRTYLHSGVVRREDAGTAFPNFFRCGNAFPHSFHVFVCCVMKVNSLLRKNKYWFKNEFEVPLKIDSFLGTFPHFFFKHCSPAFHHSTTMKRNWTPSSTLNK